MQTIPAALEADVRRDLAGEAIRWRGSPDGWLMARGQLPALVVGIPFFAFSVFWETMVLLIDDPKAASFKAFGIPWGLMFVGVGLSLVLSPICKAWMAKRTLYVVTDARAVIYERALETRIASFPRSAISSFERHSAADGSGNLVFLRTIERGSRRSKVTEIGFLGLTDVGPAERALRELLGDNR